MTSYVRGVMIVGDTVPSMWCFPLLIVLGELEDLRVVAPVSLSKGAVPCEGLLFFPLTADDPLLLLVCTFSEGSWRFLPGFAIL